MTRKYNLKIYVVKPYKRKAEPTFPHLPCKAWTPRNIDKGANSTWLYLVMVRIHSKKSVFPIILILRRL